MEVTKKEYIDKLKRELENVEERYLFTINQNCMVGEDYRSTAFKNMELIKNLTVTVKAREDELVNRDSTIIGLNIQIQELNRQLENERMCVEDQLQEVLKHFSVGEKWKELFERSERILDGKMELLLIAEEELGKLRSAAPAAKVDVETMTTIIGSFFDK